MKNKCINVNIANHIATIQLNRPKALNALNNQLISELESALYNCDKDSKVRVIIITGDEKSFAAGADIKEMAELDFAEVSHCNLFASLNNQLANMQKVVIAVVSGYALGGGCELAMACDFIMASDSAKFSQPEITIGTLPGIAGTQRLTRAIGKAKAMQMCLTGRMMDAKEAEIMGLVASVHPIESLQQEAQQTALKIAGYSLPVVKMVKDAVNYSFESSLSAGIEYERKLFFSSFALADRQEGMQAFGEKRKPQFSDK